jgi:hypothetical protein
MPNNNHNHKGKRNAHKRVAHRPSYQASKPREMRVQRSLAPNNMTVKLRFIDYLDTLVTGTYYAQNVYNFFNIYKIQGNFVSPQAIPGLNEWGALYSKYRVVGVYARFEFVNANTAPVFMIAGFEPSNPPVTVTAWADIMKLVGYPRFRSRLLGIPNGGHDHGILQMYTTPWSLEGKTKQQFMDDPGYMGTTNASGGTPVTPAYNPIFNTFVLAGIAAGLLAANSISNVQIELEVQFTNLATLIV